LDHFVPEGRAGGLEPPSGSHRPARKLHPLAFGLERVGLISLRAPITGAIIFTLLVIAAVFGLERLKARPVTTLCIACKSDQEARERP